MMVASAIVFLLIVIVMAVLFAVAILFPEVIKHEDKYLKNS